MNHKALALAIFAMAGVAMGAIAQTLAPGFSPATYSSPITATTASASTQLPAGWTVVVYNTGANIAYVNFGPTSAITATTAHNAIPASGGCGFYVFPNTWMATITASSTTTLNVAAGNGAAPSCW